MKKVIEIDGKKIGAGNPTFIVAEMSANHNQDYNRAVEIMHAAKEAGADAIKIQTYTADTITIDSDKSYFKITQGTLWDGRTLYDLESTIARIKAATSHLKSLKIAIMGCIVNGPGEMADADYGYVGAGVGKVSLYRKKECVEKNIPAEEAVDHLLKLIEEDKKSLES